MAFIPSLHFDTLPKACLLFLFLSFIFQDVAGSSISKQIASVEKDDDSEDSSPDENNLPLDSLYYYYNRNDNGNDVMRESKRGLSLFAQLKPYYTRKSGVNTRSDFVSAVARGGAQSRPLGQPLRWG